MLERTVKDEVKRILTRAGAWYCMPAAGRYGRAGVPDFIACYNGIFFAIECKASAGVLSALQLRTLDQIGDAGGMAMVVNPSNLCEFENVLAALTPKRKLQ